MIKSKLETCLKQGGGWEGNGISGLSIRTAGVAEKSTRGLKPQDRAGWGLVSHTKIKMKVDVSGTEQLRNEEGKIWWAVCMEDEGASAGGRPRISAHSK